MQHQTVDAIGKKTGRFVAAHYTEVKRHDQPYASLPLAQPRKPTTTLPPTTVVQNQLGGSPGQQVEQAAYHVVHPVTSALNDEEDDAGREGGGAREGDAGREGGGARGGDERKGGGGKGVAGHWNDGGDGEHPICRDFQNGRCQRGEDCRFSHFRVGGNTGDGDSTESLVGRKSQTTGQRRPQGLYQPQDQPNQPPQPPHEALQQSKMAPPPPYAPLPSLPPPPPPHPLPPPQTAEAPPPPNRKSPPPRAQQAARAGELRPGDANKQRTALAPLSSSNLLASRGEDSDSVPVKGGSLKTSKEGEGLKVRGVEGSEIHLSTDRREQIALSAAGWVVRWSSKRNCNYFFNLKTGDTQWRAPVAAAV